VTIRFLSISITSIALACCCQPSTAQEPGDGEVDLVLAEQDREPGPPQRREARPPRDRDGDDDRGPAARRPGDRGPGDRDPGDRGPGDRGASDRGLGDRARADRGLPERGPEPRRDGDRQPEGPRPGARGFGGGFGGGGFGGGGFGTGGPQFRPPGVPMAAPSRDGGLDERIARLEHKLDAILQELHALRSDQQHHGPMGQHGPGGPGGYGIAARMPHPPLGPPHPQWDDTRRMPAPPRWIDGPQPRRIGPPGGLPRGQRAGGPPREWDSPPPSRGDRYRGRDRDDDDDDDRPRGGQRERRDDEGGF